MDDWRSKIDNIDKKLVVLLNERMKCAVEIGKIKKQLGIEIYSPDREADVIANITNANSGPLSDEAVIKLFQLIIEEAKAMEM